MAHLVFVSVLALGTICSQAIDWQLGVWIGCGALVGITLPYILPGQAP
jgi:hypothetical protein